MTEEEGGGSENLQFAPDVINGLPLTRLFLLEMLYVILGCDSQTSAVTFHLLVEFFVGKVPV